MRFIFIWLAKFLISSSNTFHDFAFLKPYSEKKNILGIAILPRSQIVKPSHF